MTAKHEIKVFLSYSSQESPEVIRSARKWCKAAAPASELIDFKPVLATNADDIRGALRASIEKCSRVAIVWTPQSSESNWVHYEIGLADALGKAVVVLLVGSSYPALPPQLADAEKVELTTTSA
jgi:hypothetical protein